MTETLLRPNPRPLLLAMILPGAVLVAGLGILAASLGGGIPHGWSWVGGGIAAVAGLGLASITRLLATPRLAYRDGELLVSLGTPQPIRVPIDVVECFFLGQGPTMLPSSAFRSRGENGEASDPETSTIIVRLAESAEQWKHQEVRPEFGHWCDGYITIRGTWCERIHGELLQKLNRQLVEFHRQRAEASTR